MKTRQKPAQKKVRKPLRKKNQKEILPKKLVFVDVETTGTSILSDRVIEIGMYRVEDGKVVKKFHSLIDPDRYLPTDITRLTGISAAELEGAPTFSSLKDTISEMMTGAVFCAHNAHFDYSFIKAELRRSGIKFQAVKLCTVKLSRAFFPTEPRHNLDAVMERMGISCENRHRALDDARVLVEFYQKLVKTVPQKKLLEVIRRITKHPSLPPRIGRERIEAIPENPGVYVIYDESHQPLYVGKSVNLRDRVLSHFSDSESSKELKIKQQIASIETIETAGELGALLREAKMVKENQPMLNRMLRQQNFLVAATYEKNKDGYFFIKLERKKAITPKDFENMVRLFRSLQQAKEFFSRLAKEQNLCEKMLGVSTTKGRCFGYDLGRCAGACIGEESPAKHNLKFLTAISGMKVKAWPFPGRIIIREESLEGKREGHVVDQWCYLGSVKDEEEINQKSWPEATFDYDHYKILAKYILSPHNQKHIHVLE
jgi:DNA polymerase-3 subunit epsilon